MHLKSVSTPVPTRESVRPACPCVGLCSLRLHYNMPLPRRRPLVGRRALCRRRCAALEHVRVRCGAVRRSAVQCGAVRHNAAQLRDTIRQSAGEGDMATLPTLIDDAPRGLCNREGALEHEDGSWQLRVGGWEYSAAGCWELGW
jgi:hypothetical protein